MWITRLFCHDDDFVILEDDDDLQCIVKGESEALIVKVRGVFSSEQGDLKEITLLSRIVRYGQTANGYPSLD